MRRAVRDYKYEVNEGRMTDECIQYLTQLQKDWERHRVKLGVEAMRKEVISLISFCRSCKLNVDISKIVDRGHEREGSISSLVNRDDSSSIEQSPSIAPSDLSSQPQQSIDALFDRHNDISIWEPIRPPQALGELLDSRYMLPLLFPSDPQLLAAVSGKKELLDEEKRVSLQNLSSLSDKNSDKVSFLRGPLPWATKSRRLREVGVGTLKWVDGIRSASRWGQPVAHDYEPPETGGSSPDPEIEEGEGDPDLRVNTHTTHLTRKPSGRAKGRLSDMGETTPINTSFGDTRPLKATGG
jgi:hypothetical protein